MSVFLPSVVMLNAIKFECRYAKCDYADSRCAECYYGECRYAERHYAKCHFAECRGACLGHPRKDRFKNVHKMFSESLQPHFLSVCKTMDLSPVL